MKVKELMFEEIFPYVRHVHLSGIEPFIQSTLLRAFDYRLFFIYDGKGYFIVRGQKYIAGKGNLFLWQPGTEYLIYSEPSCPLVIIGVNFDFTWNNIKLNFPIPPEKSKNFNEEKIIEYIRFTDTEAFNEPIYFKDFQAYENILLEINNEYVAKKKYYVQRVCGLFLSLIGIIARYISAPNTSLNSSFNNIDLLLDYIHINYDQPISNEEIGLRYNFHPNYINKLMVLHTGTSLHQYLINYRLSKAANMMQTSSKSISEIAFSVGYKDISYFSKAFKNKYGESPSNFRSRFLGLI